MQRTRITNSIEPLEARIAPAVFVVNLLGDTSTVTTGKLTLRQAINAANTAGGKNTIVFAPGLHGVIDLAGTTLDISSNINIDGPGGNKIIIDAQLNSGIFEVMPSVQMTVGVHSMA